MTTVGRGGRRLPGVRSARRAAAWCGAGLVLVLLPATAPAARGEPPEVLELSSDGSHYSRSLTDLFGPVSLVPMTQSTDTFWVRNSGAEPASMDVIVTNIDIPDPAVAHAIWLSVSTPGRPGEGLRADRAAPCLTLAAGQTLAPGQSVQVTSAVAMADLDGTQGQGASVALALRVTLSERQVAHVGDTSCREPVSESPPREIAPHAPGSAPAAAEGSRRLPQTGAPDFSGVLVAGLLVAGVLLRAAAGRRGPGGAPEPSLLRAERGPSCVGLEPDPRSSGGRRA